MADTVLWEGVSKTMAAVASKGRVAAERYVVTPDEIRFTTGTLSTREERVPMWAVRDIDLKQSMSQKARRVGDLHIRVEHSDYTARQHVTLSAIEDPHTVRGIIDQAAAAARDARHAHMQTQTVQHVNAAPAATPAGSVADELVKLAQLRDAGVLTVEEFEAQKARLLGG